MDLESVRSEVETIIRDAGKLVMEFYGGPLTLDIKSNPMDYATQADKEAEKLIVGSLLELYPDHHFVGEEGGGQGADRETAEYMWFIDPVDGTANFAHQIPFFSVSIAMVDKDYVPMVGAVLDPIRDELFIAAKGLGATCDGKPMQVSDVDQLSLAVVSSGFPINAVNGPDNNLDHWEQFVKKSGGPRRFASAALETAYVAAGRMDGFWERHLNPWDVMGGVTCVLEAGGQVTDYEGEERPQQFNSGKYVVSNGKIHQAMLDILAS